MVERRGLLALTPFQPKLKAFCSLDTALEMTAPFSLLDHGRDFYGRFIDGLPAKLRPKALRRLPESSTAARPSREA